MMFFHSQKRQRVVVLFSNTTLVISHHVFQKIMHLIFTAFLIICFYPTLFTFICIHFLIINHSFRLILMEE